MSTEKMVQEAGTADEAKSDYSAKLAQYVAQQPRSRRNFDRVMKVLEVAALALIAGYLAWAIYVSISWSAPNRIAAVWFCLPITVVVLMVLVGVHAAGLGAFFPVMVPGGPKEFVTGSKAVANGVGMALVLLVVAAFWGVFAWGMWTVNWTILEPLIQITVAVVGVGVVIAVASDLYKKLFRAR
jgi:hypothetical protein